MRREDTTSRERFSNDYIRELPPELEGIEVDLQRDGLFGVQLHRSEGAFLSFLTALRKPQCVVEIGGLYGASASWILKALPSSSQLITLEKSPERAEVLSRHLHQHVTSGRLKVVVGEALTELAQLDPNFSVEMVFIDADKGGYPDYLAWAEKRLSAGGLLVADNTFLFGAVLEPQAENVSAKSLKAMQEFNSHVQQSPAWSGLLLPSTEGMTLALRTEIA